MGTISVRGIGSVATPPDEAVVTVELSALEKSRQDAFRNVADRSEKLEALCAELLIEPSRRTTSGVSVAEQVEWERDRHVSKGYRALTRIVFRLDDPPLVARLLEESVVRVDARVDGPWWSIKRDNPAHLEARRLAALDARRKAEALAGALGARLGGIERVAEPGSEGPKVPTQGVALRAMSAAIDSPGPAIELQPGELFVEAAVEITFSIEES